jgi:hypothetical protein
VRVVCWASEIIFVSRTDAWGSGSSAFRLKTFGLGLPFRLHEADTKIDQ